MDELNATEPGTLRRLRGYLSERELALNTRLPPERELSRFLGVSRADLRKALSVLESKAKCGATWDAAPSSARDRSTICTTWRIWASWRARPR
jgi:DNA-binding transcriptional MocR family regulator